MRKLVTVRQVNNVIKHPDADNLDVVTIDGWSVVCKSGEFKVGDSGVFFEVDSFLPIDDLRFGFLHKNKITWNGKEGVRIRTIKLRGQLSQGLFMPIADFPEVTDILVNSYINIAELDFTETLHVEKWEPVIPACLAGQVKGPFPSWIPKTDQERIQNLVTEVFETPENRDAVYEVTVKLDGSSMTAYWNNGEVGVCSRNLELKINEENANNTLVKLLIDSGLEDAMFRLGYNYAYQGEAMGPGIQGNREQLKAHQFYIFDIYDINAGKYLTPFERRVVMHQLYNEGYKGSHVPIIGDSMALIARDVDGLLAYAEGPSINHPIREGLVYKRVDGKFSFKTISNKFLLSEK